MSPALQTDALPSGPPGKSILTHTHTHTSRKNGTDEPIYKPEVEIQT